MSNKSYTLKCLSLKNPKVKLRDHPKPAQRSDGAEEGSVCVCVHALLELLFNTS